LEDDPAERAGVGPVAGPELAYPGRERNRLAAPLPLELGVPHVLVQPAGQALAVLVDEVVGQPADRAVDLDPLADRVAVEPAVPAVNQLDDPGSLVPAAVPDPGGHEDQPPAVRVGGAVAGREPGRDLGRQLRRYPLVGVDEVD